MSAKWTRKAKIVNISHICQTEIAIKTKFQQRSAEWKFTVSFNPILLHLLHQFYISERLKVSHTHFCGDREQHPNFLSTCFLWFLHFKNYKCTFWKFWLKSNQSWSPGIRETINITRLHPLPKGPSSNSHNICANYKEGTDPVFLLWSLTCDCEAVQHTYMYTNLQTYM